MQAITDPGTQIILLMRSMASGIIVEADVPQEEKRLAELLPEQLPRSC